VSFLKMLDWFALRFLSLFVKTPPFMEAEVSEYASEVAQSIERLADMAELIADGLFAIAAGMNTDTLGNQRNMAAVFRADADQRYGDVLKKLTDDQKKQLENFVDGLCRGKRR